MTGRRSHGRLSALNGVVHQGNYDAVFCLQVLMYLDDEGLEAWAAQFAGVTSELVIMVPARNFVKDEVFDRVFGLHELRTTMVRFRP